jgi:hypothetical protein
MGNVCYHFVPNLYTAPLPSKYVKKKLLKLQTSLVLGKGKDIPVTGRGGPWGCERSRLPHYLDKRLKDGSKVVSPMRPPHFTPRSFLRFLVLISVRG